MIVDWDIITLFFALPAAYFLLRHQIPGFRRHLKGDTHPAILMLDVGFVFGLACQLLSPIGLILPFDGIGYALIMTGLSMLAFTGFASAYVVYVKKIRP